MKWFFLVVVLSISHSAYAQSNNGFTPSYWGFIKSSAIYSTEALATYNNINLSSPTHAVGHLPGRSQEKTSRMSFQTQQTRIGLGLTKEERISGKLEFDFIDFNKSSPTTQMVPRVRIASATYLIDSKNKIIIGQDWDMFSPVNMHTFNYVGNYFLAGNTGFMRQQAQFIHDSSYWEWGAAVGMAGNNPGVTDANLELGKSPTYVLRLSRKLEKGRVGLSGIYSRLHFESNNSTHDSYAGNAFYEKNFGAYEIKSEIYYGQNLANLGALSIGKGTDVRNVREYGGAISGLYRLLDRHSLVIGLGLARADNSTEVTPLTIAATNVITEPGVLNNFVKRLGWDYKITEDFSWISEVTHYETKSKIATGQAQINSVTAFESGIQLRF